MLKWEGELFSFSLAAWMAASQASSKLSHCINHEEIIRKINLRWYITPNRLAHMKPDSFKLCWRKCGNVGTQIAYVVVLSDNYLFRCQVNDHLTKVLGCNVALCPELVILDIHLVDFPKSLRTGLQHVIISARFVEAQESQRFPDIWGYTTHSLSLPLWDYIDPFSAKM